MMLEPDANFYEIQNAFHQEWDGVNYEKGKGWKQFHRWESFWETRVMEDGSFPMYSKVWKDFEAMLTGYQAKSGGLGDWQPIGPFDYNNTDSWSPGTGRVNCIVEDPNDPNTLYIGAPAGGVWKSTDAGSNWTPLGDELSVIGVSGIAIDPTNSDIVYLCTGDTDAGDTYSIGVLKSTDGGITWNSVGGITATKTTEILIDPTNTDVLYLSTSSGLFKSTNGGTTFANILSGNIRDIDMKPGTPSTIYAVSSSEFYKSTNSGGTWNTITNGLPATSDRLAIATTADDADYVYVLSAGAGGGYQGVYRSTNSATSFTAQNTTTDVFESTQSWYDMAIACSQTDRDEIVTGVLNVWRSSNGGNSFTQLNSWSNPGGNAYTHADIHYLKYYGNNLYCGSDGGIYKSTNGGNNFTDLTAGLQIGQFYRIGGSQNDVDVLAGGLQDNGGFAYVGGVWKVYYGADGMEAGVDRNNSNLIFGMIQNGDLYRSTNGGNTSSGQGSPESGRWVTPMAMDPNNDRLLAGYDDLHEFDYASGWNQLSTFNFPQQLRNIEIYEGNSNIIFVSTDDNLYRTVDGGTNFTEITGSLPTNSVITSIEVNPTDADELWITRGGWNANDHVFHTTDGGVTWVNITAGLPNLPCNIVKHDAGTNAGIYVGTDIGVYYYDEDLGTWIQFSGNLPNVIVNDLEINESNNIIRCGTYGRGVWESDNYVETNYDASISAIISPVESYCNENSFDPIVTLFNYGATTLTSCEIYYDIDGVGGLTYNWTGSLAQGTSIDVTLPTMTTSVGTHIFNSSSSNPNGQTDEGAGNDANSLTFVINPSGTPLDFNIITDCWGSETTWEIVDGTGATVVNGGPYSDVDGGEVILENLCLATDCYDLIVYDSYGDGVFGSQWGSCSVDGDFNVMDGATVLVQMADPDFGNSVTENFCVTGPTISAAFSANNTTICEGETVDFTDASIDGIPTSWDWTFSGASPGTSTNQNPSGVVYNTAGTWDVELTVNDGTSSNTITLVDFITVNPSPTLTVSTSDALCGLDNGTATAIGSGGTGTLTYSWDSGDTGASISGLAVGAYTVTVTDVNGCSNQMAANVSNSDGPTPTITPDQTICEGTAVDIIGGGAGTGGSYDWDNGLGAGATQNVAPTSTTTYTVTVTDLNGCSALISTTITVEPSPVVNVTPSSATICEGETISLTASGAGTYLWDTGSNASTITESPSSTTTYSVTGTTGSCTGAATNVLVTVEPNPIAVANSNTTFTVPGVLINFDNIGSTGTSSWDFGDATTSSLDSPDHAYATDGTYTVVLTSTLGNCVSTDTIIITIGVDGITESTLLNEFSVYPNPTNGSFNVIHTGQKGEFEVEVYDAIGEIVVSSNSESGQAELNIAGHAEGVYFLRIVLDNEIIIKKVTLL